MITNHKEELRLLIDICGEITNQYHGMKCDEMGDLANKFFLSSIISSFTIYCLSYPIDRKEFPKIITSINNRGSKKIDKFNLKDVASIFSILRMLYENYVNMNYLLISPNDKDEKELRILLWNIQTTKETLTILELINSKNPRISEVKSRFEEYNRRLRKNKYYNNTLHEKLIKDSRWSKLNKKELALSAGIGENFHSTFYKHFSNYSHSEGLSLGRIDLPLKDSDMIINMAVHLTSIILAWTLNAFRQILKSTDLLLTDYRIISLLKINENIKKADFRTLYN